MAAVTHLPVQPQPREESRWAHAAKFVEAALWLPTAVGRAVHDAVRMATRSDGMASFDGASKLCRVRMRRDDR
jgi:hypothetical protein